MDMLDIGKSKGIKSIPSYFGAGDKQEDEEDIPDMDTYEDTGDHSALYFCVPFREQVLDYYANNKSSRDGEENMLTCLDDLFSQLMTPTLNTIELPATTSTDFGTIRICYFRMQFGVPEESSLGDGLGEGYGMLRQAGNGRLRVSAAQSKLDAKVAKKFKEKSYGSSGATSGLTSSLAFTPVQGIELSNPQGHGNLLGSGTQSTYFSETGTFSKIKRT